MPNADSRPQLGDNDTPVSDARSVRQVQERTNLVRYKLADALDSFTADERFRGEPPGYDDIWVLGRH